MPEVTRKTLLQMSLASLLVGQTNPAEAATPLRNGVDISWVPHYEAAGGRFYTTTGKLIDPFALLKQVGAKVARIRIFVNPSYRNGRLSDALSLASRARSSGLDVCLDFHFSDDWADPGKQSIPAAWSKTDVNLLATQVKQYVRQTLQEFKNRNLSIAYVQLGNEIANGMMWPLGKIDSSNAVQWRNLAKLYNSATESLREIYPNAENIIHLDCGGDANRVRWWLMNASYYRMRDFNIVGLSYYPQWHGTLKDLTETLEVVAWEFEKKVLIAETAYPYTPTSFGADVINPSRNLVAGFPATPAGQAAYLKKLTSIVKGLSYGNGVGVWWWEGLSPRVNNGGQVIWDSGMTNSTLVNESGKALASLANLKS